ncbi:tetratricopeptide-like domain-containing protein [Desulfonema limicola]|uniref:Tetratricopeptide-like domain-containing protein n=2 Tax=Desulfonema limicola TaxID=45656 RepID=A0A975BCW9_9BACT|nr:tetratricopeptide-like domain-containing protein [Desulfonema limicola]
MAVVAVPKKKTNEILNKLFEIFSTGLYDDFTLTWCKAEAEKLKRQDVFLEDVYNILGMLACIEGDIDNMHSYYRSALGYSGNSFFSLSNYSASLVKSTLYKEAYEYALKAFEIEKSDEIILDALIYMSYLLQKKEFTEYIQIYKKIFGKDHKVFSTMSLILRNVAVPVSYAAQYSKIIDIIEKCVPGLEKCFAYPLFIELELMQAVDGVDERWTGWIISIDSIETGLDKMDLFHDWCIDKQVDKGVDNFHFNIDFLGA